MLFLGRGLSLVAEMQKNSLAGALTEEKELLILKSLSTIPKFSLRDN